MTTITRPLFLSIAFCLISACATAGSDSWVELKGKRFTVEVADAGRAVG